MAVASAMLFTATSCAKRYVRAESPVAALEKSAYPEEYRMNEAFDSDAMSPAPARSARAGSVAEAKPSKKRMVHYNGYARMRSAKPRDLLDKAKNMVVESGGYVEQIRETTASFRVPVKEFRNVFKKILALGDVLSKDITASDITDAYSDIDLKLKIAKASRNRYIELLEQTQDEEEKLSLLKEISRLNESIEAMENMLKTLGALAEFSRISLDVTGIDTNPVAKDKQDIYEFRWIHDLSPFSRSNLENGERLAFDVPADMVDLGGKNFIVESADGAVFYAYKRKNKPEGNSAFWADAVKTRIEQGFKSVTFKTEGKFTCLRCESLSDKPYVYIIGLCAEGENLNVFEAYYPTLDHEKRFDEAITRVVEKDAK
jgi:hypothetical protein